MPDLLFSGPSDARTTLLLAHGAGVPMDSPWMNAVAGHLAAQGTRVARFEFAYMAARRSGQRKPPPRAETLIAEYRAAIAALPAKARLVVGGKSMGGRVASMIADDLFADGKVAGLVCLGYPFHPPGSPGELRIAHLERLACPALICQGTRDPFGTRQEVATYGLSPKITLGWLEDGDHDFKPRKASGMTPEGHLEKAARTIGEWLDSGLKGAS